MVRSEAGGVGVGADGVEAGVAEHVGDGDEAGAAADEGGGEGVPPHARK